MQFVDIRLLYNINISKHFITDSGILYILLSGYSCKQNKCQKTGTIAANYAANYAAAAASSCINRINV